MNRSRSIFLAVSLTTVFFVVGGSMWASTAARQPDDGSDSLYKYLSVFTEVLNLVDRAYVDETDPDVLLAGAFEGAVDALDPFSLYVPADDLATYEATRKIGTERSGLMLLKERGVAYVAAIEKDSPAAKAGLETGDIVSGIQGEATRPMPLYRIHALLAGPIGTKIEVERIHRGSKQKLAFELAEFPPAGVELEVKQGIAVMTIGSIHESTPADVALALENLASGDGLEGLETKDELLIDLRDVGGGNQRAAYRVAGLFHPGELGVLAKRDEVVETFAVAGAPRWQGRLVVLIDRSTQGAAEIVATVLHQTVGAVLVGVPSFGHSGRQSLVELSNGGRLQLTDAFFTGPDRKPIRGSLEPDVLVRPSYPIPDDEAADPILERGLKVLLDDEVIEEKIAA